MPCTVITWSTVVDSARIYLLSSLQHLVPTHICAVGAMASLVAYGMPSNAVCASVRPGWQYLVYSDARRLVNRRLCSGADYGQQTKQHLLADSVFGNDHAAERVSPALCALSA